MSLSDAAVRAVSSASLVCRFVQRQLETIRTITKDDRSPVTVADFAAQAVVGKMLRESLGDVRLVAEEASAFLRDVAHGPHVDAALAAAREAWPGVTRDELLDAIDIGSGDPHADGYWTLDPIDGTKGFIRGQQYAVCLAYIVGSEPVVGVLGCPNLPASLEAPLDKQDPAGCIYIAERGAGAWRADAGPTTRLRCAPWEPGMPVAMCESVDAGHTDHSANAAILARLGPAGKPARLDSQCKYAVVARGQADLYLRLPTRKDYVERIWDHASGDVIAEEAGCTVTDVRGVPLDFSHGRGLERNRGIVVAPPRLHPLVIAAAREIAPA